MCKECKTGFNLLYNYKCCANNKYWDTTTSTCKTYNAANVGDKHKSNIETNCTIFDKNF